jgi:hypothetical protein
VADLKKENGQENKEVKTVSALSEKRQYLLDELSELMEQESGDYGPFLMKELQRRLEFVVQNFNEELKALIQNSFEDWKIKDSQLRDLIAGNLKVPKSPAKKEKPEDSTSPNFIKDVKFGPVRRK